MYLSISSSSAVGHVRSDAADAVLEPLGGFGGGRQLGPCHEELVLQREDVGRQLFLPGPAGGAGDAEGGAGFVERSVGVSPQARLFDTAAVPEAGGAVVAFLRIDLEHVSPS